MFLKFQNTIINIKNIGFIKKKNYKYFCQYRKKASIKEIQIHMAFGDLNDSQYFMKHGFYKLDDYFINPNAINFVNAEPVKDSKDVNVHFSFMNGLELEFKIDQGRFNVWVDNRLRNSRSR
jgi:hypothetical protein